MRFVGYMGFVLAAAVIGAAVAGFTPAMAQQKSDAPLFYDQRRLPDMEVERRNQDVIKEQRTLTEERRREAEALARRQAEEANRRAEDARIADEEKRIAAEAEAKRKAEEAQRFAAEAKSKADEAQRIAAEVDAKRKADDEKRVSAEADAKRKADDEKRVAAEADVKRKADDEKRVAAEADAKRRADEERRVAAEADVKRKSDDEKRVAAEADAKRKADEERRVAAEADAKRRADEEKRVAAEADAKRKADEERRVAAEADAKRRADEEKRVAAEADVKRKADEEKRVAAEADAKRKADEEKRVAAETDAKRKADEEKRVAAAAAAQRAPAQTAALAPPVTNAINPGPAAAGGACEAAKVTTSALSGGKVLIAINSECRRAQPVTIQYGGFDMIGRIGPSGQANLVLDLFLGKGGAAKVTFADGSSQAVDASVGDLGGLSKVALIWRSAVDLDLHAIEGGGAFGNQGHRWPGAASTLEAAQAESAETGHGAGFLSTADDGAHEGTKVEIYTFVHSAEQETGAVSMLIDYASRGGKPSGEMCGTGALAEIPFEVVIFDRKGRITRESGVIPAAKCGETLAGAARYLKDAVPDLRFRH